jgi:hypothetical protein
MRLVGYEQDTDALPQPATQVCELSMRSLAA